MPDTDRFLKTEAPPAKGAEAIQPLGPPSAEHQDSVMFAASPANWRPLVPQYDGSLSSPGSLAHPADHAGEIVCPQAGGPLALHESVAVLLYILDLF